MKRKMKIEIKTNYKLEELNMRKAIITAGLLVAFGTTVIAQSPANVEKAKRFRTNETKFNLVSTAAAQEIKVQKQNELSNDTILKASAQVKELGSRYAVAWSNNAAQLKELGSSWDIGMENAAVTFLSFLTTILIKDIS